MEFRDNLAVTCAVVAEGTNANTFKTSQGLSYTIGGRGYFKAATDNVAFTAGTAMAASQRCAIFVLIDGAGTFSTQQGSIVSPSPSGDVLRAAEIPNPTDKAVVGAFVVTTGAAGAFTPGATDLSAANVTFTTVDFVGDYAKPINL